MFCDGSNEDNKKTLSERDICTKFVTPALIAAGWDLQSQLREEVTFTAGRVIVRGSQVSRGEARRADYVLYYKPGIPIAVIEVKDNAHSVGAGMQQALTALLQRADMNSSLVRYLFPPLNPQERVVAEVEGWILGVV